MGAFVRGVMSVGEGGKCALFAVGPKLAGVLASEGRSALAIYEFLAKEAPAPAAFQAAIDSLPGAIENSKLLYGKRRVRSLTFHTELDHLVELLRHPHLQPVLKEEHVKAVEEPDTTRSLALEVQKMLATLETNCEVITRTAAATAAAARRRSGAASARSAADALVNLGGRGDSDGEEEEDPLRQLGVLCARQPGLASRSKKRSASLPERQAMGAFVRGVVSVGEGGKCALFAVGPKLAGVLASEGRSALAIYEFLAKEAPAPAAFQAAIDSLPGAIENSKLLYGKRRVRSLTFHTELDHLVELLRHPHLQPVLKEEHVKAVEEPDTTRSLALEVQKMLATLETNCEVATRTVAAARGACQRLPRLKITHP